MNPPDPRSKRPLDFTLQQMRTFCTVFRLGSYASAARLTNFSTSAVWEQVKELEKQYGTALFKRRGKSVAPTAEAHRLNELFLPLLAGLESTREHILESSGTRPARITLATGARMLIEETSTALQVFTTKHPDVKLRIMHTSSRGAIELVLSGEVDLAMALEPGPDYVDKAVTVRPAYEIDYLLIARKNHALAKKRGFRFAAITNHPLIVHHRGSYSRHLLEQTLHTHNLHNSVQIAVESDNSAFTAACVRAGLGIGIIAGRPDGFLCKGLFVKSLARWMGRARIAFMWKRGAYATDATKELMETIRKVMEQ